MKKKALSLGLAVVLSMSVFAGCAGGNTDKKETSTNDKASEKKVDKSTDSKKETKVDDTQALIDKYKPDPNKKYTYTWTGYQMGPIDEDPEMVKYWEEKFNIDIDLWNIEDSKQLNLKFASGQVPDRMGVNFNEIPKYIEQELITDVPEEVIKAYAPKIYKAVEEAEPGLLNKRRVNGKIYGITQHYQMSYRTPIAIRGDWMENVGVTKAPATLDEFESLMYKFTNEDPDKNGKKDTYGMSKSMLSAVYGAYGYGDGWFDKDGKAVYGYTQPEMKDALARLAKWYKDGVIDPEFITGENAGGYWAISHSFTQGRVGASSKASWYHWSPAPEGDYELAGTNIKELYKVNKDAAEKVVYVNPPTGPNGIGGTVKGNNYSSALWVFGIGMQDDPGKIGRLLEITDAMCAEDYETYATAYFGKKGEHWDYDEDGRAKNVDGIGGKELSAMGAHVLLLNVQLRKFLHYNEPESSKWVYKAEIDKHALETNISNMPTFDSKTKFGEEMSKIQKEAYIKIITGEESIDYFDEFVAKWNKAGGEKWAKEVNDWYTTQSK